jgi:hypothetical protein
MGSEVAFPFHQVFVQILEGIGFYVGGTRPGKFMVAVLLHAASHRFPVFAHVFGNGFPVPEVESFDFGLV